MNWFQFGNDKSLNIGGLVCVGHSSDIPCCTLLSYSFGRKHNCSINFAIIVQDRVYIKCVVFMASKRGMEDQTRTDINAVQRQSSQTRPFVLFHTAESHPDTYFLSNFYPHGFNNISGLSLELEYDGQIWPTSEHLYQALKFRCDNDYHLMWRGIIRTASTPSKAKYLGNLRTDVQYRWMAELRDTVFAYRPYVQYADAGDTMCKMQRMLTVLRLKFNIPYLQQMLLDTGTGKLSEDSMDGWGWRKGNLLGDCLMIVRDEIRHKLEAEYLRKQMYNQQRQQVYEQQVYDQQYQQIRYTFEVPTSSGQIFSVPNDSDVEFYVDYDN